MLVYFCCFLVIFYTRGNYTKNLIYLKTNGEKIDALIVDIKDSDTGYFNFIYNRFGFKFTVSFEYENNTYKKVITEYESKGFNKNLSDYQLGKKISILVNKDNLFLRPANTINKEIIREVLAVMIFFPILISIFVFLLIISLWSFLKRNRYKYYIQDNKYKINIKHKDKNILKKQVEKLINLNKLKNKDVICYGISKGKYFCELFHNKEEFYVRIFIGEEYEENLDKNENIKNQYYSIVKSKLSNGT